MYGLAFWLCIVTGGVFLAFTVASSYTLLVMKALQETLGASQAGICTFLLIIVVLIGVVILVI